LSEIKNFKFLILGDTLIILPKFLNMTDQPKQTWKRKSFDESILSSLSNRERAEVETNRDLSKPIEQLLCDVHEETHNPNRSPEENIASAQKRMVSLMARVAISSDKSATIMTCLTYAIVAMTFVLVVLTIVLAIKA